MSAALEKHYRVRELAKIWGFCDNTVIRIFAGEPEVIRLDRSVGQRKYVTISIPESVALRVHEQLTRQPLQAAVSVAKPVRVIRLSDFGAGASRKPGNVVKLRSG
jgi:hypothetical protein